MLSFIIFVIILPMVIAARILAPEYLRSRKAVTHETKTVKALPKPHKMSWIGRAIMTEYNNLPDEHKPSYDLRAAIVALDVKYQIHALDNHFKPDRYMFGGPRCSCSTGNNCKKFPEFISLWNGIREITSAMKRLEQAKWAREREIELAGVENDLRSVDDILAGFRMEAEVLHETAKEIRP